MYNISYKRGEMVLSNVDNNAVKATACVAFTELGEYYFVVDNNNTFNAILELAGDDGDKWGDIARCYTKSKQVTAFVKTAHVITYIDCARYVSRDGEDALDALLNDYALFVEA